jgi:hypothetical protein
VDDQLVIYVRDGSAAIAPIVLVVAEAGGEAREVMLSRPTLDDVFLRKTGHHLVAGAPVEQLQAAGESR